MSLYDTIDMLENQIAKLQDARMEEARERDRLRQRVAVLEMVIREELRGDDCEDDANRMIVDFIHDKMSPALSPSQQESK